MAKSKHRKRRLFTSYTFEVIKKILVQGGKFQFTTDNINYAFNAKNIIEKTCSEKINFSRSRGSRPITKYELKAEKKRNFIFDLIYFETLPGSFSTIRDIRKPKIIPVHI